MSTGTKSKQRKSASTPEGFVGQLAPFRTDILCALALALVTFLIWCAVYNRWSADSWQIPIFYPHLPSATDSKMDVDLNLARGDVMQQFAIIKAASEGHILPVAPTNIPELGAPYVANWDDYPFTEKAIYWGLGIVARFIGVFAAANFACLLEDVLAALSFYAACRLLNGSRVWAFAGGIVFAFARFGFGHMIHHIPTAYVWHVPLCLLIFRWIIGEEGIRFGTKRFIFAVVVAAFTGIQNPYNTNMFAQLVLIGGAIVWWRTRDWNQWRACLPAVSLVATAAAFFIFVNSNTFLYHARNGGNRGAVARSYFWMELYGLKLVDMVMPPPDHRFPPFADWGESHLYSSADPVTPPMALQPGEKPTTAYLGVVALAALSWLVAGSIRRAIHRERVPLEAWLVLWIYIYAEVGGVNGVIGTLGFQLFRATTRYSLWILCIALMYGVRRLSSIDLKVWYEEKFGASPWATWLPHGIAICLVGIALFDQVPPIPTSEELDKLASWVASDRNFALSMERSLPPKAMVFQLPVMMFPENPNPISSYDNLRPYLYTHNLRYSFGTDKGRGTEIWQYRISQFSRISLKEFIDRLEKYGFGALYVNRVVLDRGGEQFFEQLKSLGYNKIILSEKGDLACVILNPSPTPMLPNDDPTLPVWTQPRPPGM
ncbi:MAG TPA: hypothetical protein VG733_15125 [Chthoniobacteraceae bacterium]|nr:hypothetical protein [Chthoniobacteraceae bacterium]